MTTPQTSPAPQPLESSDPWRIGSAGALVRGVKRITDWITGLSPVGATIHTVHDFAVYTSTDGKVVITGDRDGFDVSLHVRVDASITLAGGVGQIGTYNFIPGAWRPRRTVYGSAILNGVPSVLELDAAGTLKYITGASSQPGLSGTIAYKVAG